MVAIFPNLSLWRRSLCSNLAGINPEKLYRATLMNAEPFDCLLLSFDIVYAEVLSWVSADIIIAVNIDYLDLEGGMTLNTFLLYYFYRF